MPLRTLLIPRSSSRSKEESVAGTRLIRKICIFSFVFAMGATAQIQWPDTSKVDLSPEAANAPSAQYVFAKFNFPSAQGFTEPKAVTNNLDSASRATSEEMMHEQSSISS
jgi:hypothetical protein